LSTAAEANSVLKGEYAHIATERNHLTGSVTIENRPLPVKNKDVVIFDDVISSGKSMIKAIKWVKEQGARTIYVACVHTLLTDDAKEDVLKSGAKSIVGTDTVSSSVGVVSVAPLIAEAMRKHRPSLH